MIGRSLKTSSRPLGVVGDDGPVDGVVGTRSNFRFSGPFFSWFELLELFFIFDLVVVVVVVVTARNWQST